MTVLFNLKVVQYLNTNEKNEQLILKIALMKTTLPELEITQFDFKVQIIFKFK